MLEEFADTDDTVEESRRPRRRRRGRRIIGSLLALALLVAVGVVGLTNVVGLFLGMIAGQLYAWANLGLRAKELRERKRAEAAGDAPTQRPGATS